MKPVQVALDNRKHSPVAFQWRGKLYKIATVQECWRLVGAWWDGEGERTFFRVLTENDGSIFEICYDHQLRRWMLEKVED